MESFDVRALSRRMCSILTTYSTVFQTYDIFDKWRILCLLFTSFYDILYRSRMCSILTTYSTDVFYLLHIRQMAHGIVFLTILTHTRQMAHDIVFHTFLNTYSTYSACVLLTTYSTDGACVLYLRRIRLMEHQSGNILDR
jgi:hypothetical protein